MERLKETREEGHEAGGRSLALISRGREGYTVVQLQSDSWKQPQGLFVNIERVRTLPALFFGRARTSQVKRPAVIHRATGQETSLSLLAFVVVAVDWTGLVANVTRYTGEQVK
jgi:hypothetical protein